MNMHITNLYGARGTHVLGQHNVVKIARTLGFQEMALYCYQVACDTQGELRKRIDGITSALEDGDIVLFQSPSWNTAYYDRKLLEVIRMRNDTRIAVLICDVIPMMFEGVSEEDYSRAVEIYNMADLVIVPSEAMLDLLRKRGLKVKKILIQSMWDLPFSEPLETPKFTRQLFFSGSPNRFRFLSTWNYDVSLALFTNEHFPLNGQNIRLCGWKNTAELLTEYTKGGFGLVWEQSDRSEYYKCNQPHKLSTYLAAGIPVVMQKGLVHEQTVTEYGLGFAVGSLEEAAEVVRNISEDEYYELVNHIKNISFLIRGGFFTKKLLLDTVNYLLLD